MGPRPGPECAYQAVLKGRRGSGARLLPNGIKGRWGPDTAPRPKPYGLCTPPGVWPGPLTSPPPGKGLLSRGLLVTVQGTGTQTGAPHLKGCRDGSGPLPVPRLQSHPHPATPGAVTEQG